MNDLIKKQISNLKQAHFCILCWAAEAEAKEIRYNITNIFDDLKYGGITRTKQSAVAYIKTLQILYFIDLRDESNRKNIYITNYGAKAIEYLASEEKFKTKQSMFLEDKK